MPVRVAYDQWTQFEAFPKFMDGVSSVSQLDNERLHWIVDIAGVTREFDTTITEQIPDERVAWTTTSGPSHAGVVTFHTIDDTTTCVTLQMDFEPEGFLKTESQEPVFCVLAERPGRPCGYSFRSWHRWSQSRSTTSGG